MPRSRARIVVVALVAISAASCTSRPTGAPPTTTSPATRTPSPVPTMSTGSGGLLERLSRDQGVLKDHPYPRIGRFTGARRKAYRTAFRLCSYLGLRNLAKQLHTEAARPAAAAAFITGYTRPLWVPAYRGCVDGLRWRVAT